MVNEQPSDGEDHVQALTSMTEPPPGMTEGETVIGIIVKGEGPRLVLIDDNAEIETVARYGLAVADHLSRQGHRCLHCQRKGDRLRWVVAIPPGRLRLIHPGCAIGSGVLTDERTFPIGVPGFLRQGVICWILPADRQEPATVERLTEVAWRRHSQP